VDAISFGLAPALIMYFAVLNQQGWDWIFVFLFTMCAVIRLARFNVEQAGRAKTHFHGLPSPAAGMTLATYYWFSQTPLYTQTMIADLPWHVMLRYIMLGLGFLMISNVSYAAMPTIGFRTWRELMGTLLVVGDRRGYLSPEAVLLPGADGLRRGHGLARTVFFGLLGRLPHGEFDDEDAMLLDEEQGRDGEARMRRRRRRRRGQADRPPASLSSTPEEPRA
jgi:CDP-diacylglycerol--serine O-phosphatidyltransferase